MLSKTTTRKQIEEMVGNLGSSKKYQIIQGVIMSLCWVVIAFLIIVGLFVFMNPVFKCGNDVTEEEDACRDLTKCYITNKFTATSYSGIVCQKQHLRSTIQSAFYLGNLLALVTFAPLSDSKGRRSTSLVISFLLVLSIAMMYFGIQYSIWALVIVSQLINGVFVAGMSINTYVFTAEFCTDIHKERYIMVYWVSTSVTGIFMFFVYNYMPDWDKYLFYCLGVPAIVLFVSQYFLVLETPHFILFLQKDLTKFDACIDSLSKFNNCSPQQLTQIKSLARTFHKQHFQSSPQNTHQQHNSSLTSESSFFQSVQLLIDNRNYLWIAVRLSICKIGVNAYNFALYYCFDRLGYNFGTSLLIFGVIQVLCSFAASVILERLPKKPILIVSIIASTVFGLGYFLPFVDGNSGWESVLICLATVSMMFAFVAIGLMSVEYFPTEISSTSIGVIDCVSYTINVFMPFLVNFLHDVHLHPVATTSFILFITGLLPIIGLKNVVENPKEDLSDLDVKEMKDIKEIKEKGENKEG